MALIFGVTKFRDYLLGREFTLVTDHQPLVGLLRPDRQTPTMAAARIQRWALYLGGYKYKLQYVPGKQLLNSDALSRLPQQATGDGGEGEPPEYVLALESLDEGVVSTRELKDLTAVDTTLRKVQHYVLRGWPPSKTNVQPDLAPYYEHRLELSLAHDLVYWGNRVVIPSDARERFLQLLHETHQGSSAMKAVARSLFWWPGLDRDIEQRAANCEICIASLPMPPAAPPVNWPKTQENWSRIHIDFAGPVAGKMVLVVVDAHSKWIEAFPMKHANVESTIRALRSIFARFGVPRTIVSDNGTQFTSKEFATFAAKNNITHLCTAPFHPQSNGAAERAVRTIKEGIRKITGGDLDEKLVRLLFNYRRTPLKTGKSPSEMLLGYQIRSRLDTCFPVNITGPNDESDDWTLPPDSSVYVRNYGQGEKWIPGRVKSTTGARMVTVETPNAIVKRHVDQVRRRSDSSPRYPVNDTAAGGPGTNQTPGPSAAANGTTPLEAAAPDSTSATAQTPESNTEPRNPPLLTTAGPAEDSQQVLRRSTRQRKPVQRFHF